MASEVKPVRILGPKDIQPDQVREPIINTTSRSRTWSRGLSPFVVGPIPLYPGAGLDFATNMENAWQFSKVYKPHVGPFRQPTPEYFEWARKGWSDQRAQRYPMGKGAKPEFSWWDGQALGYVEARKQVYFRLYAKAVSQTPAFAQLLSLYRGAGEITLWDFDGYDYRKFGYSIKDCLNNPKRKMGHAFILAYLLENLEKSK